MRKGGGRAKGSRFELDLAKTISVWWTGDKALADKRAEELPFRRAPLSGGWDKKAAASDLIVTDPTKLPAPWPFALEAKCQEVWDWEGLFKGNEKWPVKAYWAQCCEAARQSKLKPLVLFTKNRSPIYFALDKQDIGSMNLHFLTTGGEWLPTVDAGWLPFSIGRFDDLLALKPQRIVEGLKRISASSMQAKGVAKPVADPVQERPREIRKVPVRRVLGGEPKPKMKSPGVYATDYGDLPYSEVQRRERIKRLPKPVKEDWSPLEELLDIMETRRPGTPSTVRAKADKNGNWI